MTGFVWICSENEEQQYLLRMSISLAKRYYPELPRLVFTSDITLQVDAECLYVELKYTNDPEPSKNIVDPLINSPFDYTYFMCNRTMIISRFDHLIQHADFEAQIRPNRGYHKYNALPYEISNAFIGFNKSGITDFYSWYQDNKFPKYFNSQHLLAGYYEHNNFKVHNNLCCCTSADRLEFLEELLGVQPRKLCGMPITHWLNFPLLDLDRNYKEFEKLMWINDYEKFKDRLY